MDINDSGAIEYEDFESFMEAHWERTCSRTAPLAPQRRLRSERLWKYYNEQQPLYELMPRSTEEQRRLKSQKARELRFIAAAAESAVVRYTLAKDALVDESVMQILEKMEVMDGMEACDMLGQH